MNGCNYDSVKYYLQKQAPSVELWFVDPSENLSHSKLFETEELTHWKRLWCWEGLGAGEGDERGWDGWMASRTQWTWVWVNSGSWCWTGRPGLLQFMGSQRIGRDWATELNWTELTLTYLSTYLVLKVYSLDQQAHHLIVNVNILTYSDLGKTGTLGMEPSNLWLNKPSRWFWCLLKSETHHSRLWLHIRITWKVFF